MFDDFIPIDFPDQNLNQAHQDAMLQAQNQAVQAQQDAAHSLPNSQYQTHELMPTGVMSNAVTNFGLLLQAVLALLGRPKS